MELTSNIWPEVAATVFGLILCLGLRIKYFDAAEANVFYRQLAYAVTLAAVVDLSSILLHALTTPLHPFVFTLTTTMFYIATVVASYCLLRYIVMRSNRQHGRFFRAQKYVLYADIFLLIVNLYAGTFFYYDQNSEIVYGALHLPVSYGVAIWFMLSACAVQAAHRGGYTALQLFVLRFAGVSMLAAFAVQFFVLRDLIFSYAVGILSVYLIFFAVEMPVYRRVADTTKQLISEQEKATEATKKALRASQTKSRFLANTSHEIRTPMNAIMGINEMIAQGTRDERILEASNEIRQAGMSLLQIINDVLDYSRIESGRMELVQNAFSLSDVLIEIDQTWRPQIEEKGIAFLVEISDRTPDDLYGDQDKLRQILTNLVSNATKYTDKGKITMRVRTGVAGDMEMLIIAVEDTGVGIREEELDKIFSLFSRASLEENRDRVGAGLGLRITEDLARMMNGSVRAESVYGEGSQFVLRIPLYSKEKGDGARVSFEQKAKAMRLRKEAPPFTAPDKRILVVDDTVVNLTVARGLLRSSQARVDAALSGEEALSLARNALYDVVLLDHMMPEMDGLEVLRRLREIDGYEQGKVSVIALTANAGETARAFYLEHGFDDYLAKPLQGQTLLALLQKYLTKPDEKETA